MLRGRYIISEGTDATGLFVKFDLACFQLPGAGFPMMYIPDHMTGPMFHEDVRYPGIRIFVHLRLRTICN